MPRLGSENIVIVYKNINIGKRAFNRGIYIGLLLNSIVMRNENSKDFQGAIQGRLTILIIGVKPRILLAKLSLTS